jgi:tetratricopeptide (TPR) repeat protein
MNSASASKAFIILLLACCALTMVNLTASYAQNYTEDQYKAFQDMQAEQAPAKKAALAIKFLQANPKNDLAKNVIGEYQVGIQALYKAGNWPEIMRLGEQFVAVVPDDSYTIGLLAEGYSNQKNYKQFAAFGEKAFARSPNANLAYAVAMAYKESGNDAKFIQFAEKTVSLDPTRFDILIELTKSYGSVKRWPEASKYANMTIKAFATAKKPDSATDANWKTSLNGAQALAYGVLGNAAYESNNFVQAIPNLEKSVSFIKNNEVAYYYLGLAYWKMNKSDMAMLNFAKAYLLKGSTSVGSKAYLDQLYKAGAGRGTLTGEDRIVTRAKMELGIQ